MNLSDRERRLLLILGGVIVVFVAYFLFFRGGDADPVPIDIPVEVVTPAEPSVQPSPVFVIPAGARDPFKP